jgi:acid stress-induced BolA-like protein IbaG/YrbA
MTADEIKSLITNGLPCEHCTLTGDGRHWYATVVSNAFEGLRPIARHQKVYATMGARLQTNEVHALSIKTFTTAEWAAQSV